MPRIDPDTVDFLESGTGPVVILVHSSVSGARQWRKLMEWLTPSFHVKAVNLFGYGRTPGWPETQTQTLDDQAELIEAILPDNAGKVHLVGHSFGGTVAMAAARRLGPLTGRLVLLEPNPFFLLRDNGRDEAFAEVLALKDFIKSCGVQGKWMEAAERFADYWGGEGTWAATDAYRPGRLQTRSSRISMNGTRSWARRRRCRPGRKRSRTKRWSFTTLGRFDRSARSSSCYAGPRHGALKRWTVSDTWRRSRTLIW